MRDGQKLSTGELDVLLIVHRKILQSVHYGPHDSTGNDLIQLALILLRFTPLLNPLGDLADIESNTAAYLDEGNPLLRDEVVKAPLWN